MEEIGVLLGHKKETSQKPPKTSYLKKKNNPQITYYVQAHVYHQTHENISYFAEVHSILLQPLKTAIFKVTYGIHVYMVRRKWQIFCPGVDRRTFRDKNKLPHGFNTFYYYALNNLRK